MQRFAAEGVRLRCIVPRVTGMADKEEFAQRQHALAEFGRFVLDNKPLPSSAGSCSTTMISRRS
jgi:hypothetical protein